MPVEYVCVNLGVYLKSFFIAYILVFIFYIVRIFRLIFAYFLLWCICVM